MIFKARCIYLGADPEKSFTTKNGNTIKYTTHYITSRENPIERLKTSLDSNIDKAQLVPNEEYTLLLNINEYSKLKILQYEKVSK